MILALVCVLSACSAKTYEVDYCGEQQMYDGAKDAYAPGKEVILRYTLIASDTSYAFYLDGEELDVEYDSNKGYFIRFTMPDHDVKLECVTKNTMADEIPTLEAEPEENIPENEPESTPAVSPETEIQPETEAQPEPETQPETEPQPEATEPLRFLSLIKSYNQMAQWDEDAALLLAESKYSSVTMHADDAADFPELAEALEQMHSMRVRSMEDEYDNLLSFAREALAGEGLMLFRPQISTLDIQVRRADSLAVSLLTDSYADHALIEGYRAFHGTNLDSATGKELMLGDVVKDLAGAAQVVKKELNSHTWNGEFYSETAVEDYFANTPSDGFSWTLDYNGVTFYFMPGDLCEPGFGSQTATVTFAQHPELFNEKYFAEPAEYIMEMPCSSPVFVNLDAESDLEEINVTGFLHEDGRFYEAFGLYGNTDGEYYYEELFACDFHPYYVKTAEGGHYLYLFCDQEEEGSRNMLLVVFDVTGGKYTRVGELNACPGFMFPDSFIIPANPSGFRLDNRDTPEQEEIYTVGENGMPISE